MALVISLRKLLRYFLDHVIIVQTHLPLNQVLHQSDLVEHLTKWSIKLSEFKVSFKVRKELKDQLFVDFLSEIIIIPPETAHTWMIFTGISPNSRRSGTNVILENGVDLVV